MLPFNLDNIVVSGNPCKGLIYKGYRSVYVDKEGCIYVKCKLRLMVKKSCKCCHEHDFSDFEDIIDIDLIEDGKLYNIIMTNISTDWESGIIDDYDLKVVEYKED